MLLRNSARCAASVVMFAGCFGISVAKADTKYWDGTATGWDSVSAWSTDANNATPDPAAIPGATDIASFNISTATADQLVNLNAAQSVQGLIFTAVGDGVDTASTVTLQGGIANQTLTLGTGGITQNANAGEATIGVNAGNTQLVRVNLTGSQTWTANGANILAVGAPGINTTPNSINATPAAAGTPMALTLDGTSFPISSTNNLAAPIFNHANLTNSVFSALKNGANAGEVLSVVKNGSGAWSIANATNNAAGGFTGGVTLNAGILGITAASGSSIGTGTLTLNGGELRSSSGAWTSAAGGLTNAIQINGNVTIAPYRMVPTLGANLSFSGTWTSSGTPGNGPVVTLAQSPQLNSINFRSQGTSGSGAIDFSNFTGTIKTTQYSANTGGSVTSFSGNGAGSNDLSKAKVVVDTTTGNAVGIGSDGQIRLGNAGAVGGVVKFGELSGAGIITYAAGTPTQILEVGALGTDSVFGGGLIQWSAPTTLSIPGNSSVWNLKKVGTGSLTLSGNNSYVGDTAIANGTLVAGVDALVSKTNITMLSTGSMSVSSSTFNNSISGNNPHGLSNGDRVMVEYFTASATNDNIKNFINQPFYVVNSDTVGNTFQLSLTSGGAPQAFLDEVAGVEVSMPTAFGAGISPIALGDGSGGAVKLLAGTATTPNVTIGRQVTIAAGGGTPTFGSEVDGNSVYSGTITLNKNANLTSVSTGANSLVVSGAISSSGAFGVSKIGSGNATLSGANTYTGDTSVLGGKLSVTSAFLANAADVYLANGTLFDLGFAGTDIIDSLFINNVMQATGTWGGAGSGATHISTLFTGVGKLQITTGVTGGVLGDYNNNGVVDAADYVLWRNGGPLQNEVDTPNTVNAADYAAWRARFGNTSGSGSGVLGGGAVPEPGGLMLIMAAIMGACAVRGRRG